MDGEEIEKRRGLETGTSRAFLKLDRFLDSLRDLQEFANLLQIHGEIRSTREFLRKVGHKLKFLIELHE